MFAMSETRILLFKTGRDIYPGGAFFTNQLKAQQYLGKNIKYNVLSPRKVQSICNEKSPFSILIS